MASGVDFLAELETAIAETNPKPKMIILGFPSNPTAMCVDLPFFERVVELARQPWPMRHGDCIQGGHLPNAGFG